MKSKKSRKSSATTTTKSRIQKRVRTYSEGYNDYVAKTISEWVDLQNDYPVAAMRTPNGRILLDDGDSIDILDL